jgi:hypothetical protein
VNAPQSKGGAVVSDPALEAEADRAGERVADGRPADIGPPDTSRVVAAGPRAVQRQSAPGQAGAPPSESPHDSSLPAAVREQGPGQVDSPSGAIYSGPARTSDIVATAPKNAEVNVVGRRGEWYEVDYQGQHGFMWLGDLQCESNKLDSTATPGLDWMTILPDAVAASPAKPKPGRGDAKSELMEYKGKARTTSYRKDSAGQELAQAGARAPGIDDKAVVDAAGAIAQARTAITARYLKPAEDGTGLGLQANLQNEQHAAGGKPPDPVAAAGLPQSQDYDQWLSTAQATTAPTERADDPSRLFHWKVYKKIMAWEGHPDTVMTYDAKNVTWGAGFAGRGGEKIQGGGAFEKLLARLKSGYAPASGVLWSAGITVENGELIVADPAKQWKLRGENAELYMRGDKQLLSLLVNLAQGENLGLNKQQSLGMRQAVLDANFQQFMAGAGAQLPAGGDVDVWALKTHAAHNGMTLPPGTSIETVVVQIKAAKPDSWTYVVPREWWHFGDPHLTDRSARPKPAPAAPPAATPGTAAE